MSDVGGTYATRGGPIHYTSGCLLIGEDLSPQRSFNGDPDGPVGVPPILRRVRHRRTGNGVEVVSSGRREHASGGTRRPTGTGGAPRDIRRPNAIFRPGRSRAINNAHDAQGLRLCVVETAENVR